MERTKVLLKAKSDCHLIKKSFSLCQDVVRRNNGEYFTNEMVNQHINVSNQRAQHLSNIMAVRETRQAIVEEKEEPGFFNTLENTAKSYILPVLSTVLGVGASVSAGAVTKRCSVMQKSQTNNDVQSVLYQANQNTRLTGIFLIE